VDAVTASIERSKPHRLGRLPRDAATSTMWGAPSPTSASSAGRFYEVPGKRGYYNYYTSGSVRGLLGNWQSCRDGGSRVRRLSMV
jgi:hypothetical protein